MLEVKQKSFLSLEATFSILITPISRRRRYNLLNTLGSTLTAQTHIDLLLTVYLRRLIYMRWKSLLCSNPATLESTIRFCMTAWFGKLQTKSTPIVLTAIKITGLKRNKSLQSSFDQRVLLCDPSHFTAELIIVN